MSNVIKVETLADLLHRLEFTEDVVVVFSAMDWCVKCKQLDPHIHAASDSPHLADYTFLEVDVDHVEGVKEAFNIMSVPQVKFYAGEDDEGRDIKSRTALQITREILS